MHSHEPIPLKFGEAIIFNPFVLHGNINFKSKLARIACNVRFQSFPKPLLQKNSEGHYVMKTDEGEVFEDNKKILNDDSEIEQKLEDKPKTSPKKSVKTAAKKTEDKEKKTVKVAVKKKVAKEEVKEELSKKINEEPNKVEE